MQLRLGNSRCYELHNLDELISVRSLLFMRDSHGMKNLVMYCSQLWPDIIVVKLR